MNGRTRPGYDLTGNVSGRCPECGASTVSPGRGRVALAVCRRS